MLKVKNQMVETFSRERISRLDGRLFIEGAFVVGQGGRLPVENPAAGAMIGQIAAATQTKVEAAVSAARKAFPAWSRALP